MKKSLYLIRHAKSSWDNLQLRDFDRPLSPKGQKDAPLMAELLKRKLVVPDVLISSPAVRALQTCYYFADAMGIDHTSIIQDIAIYEAHPDDLQDTVSNFKPEWNTVFMFGHNPGYTMFANRFVKGIRFDNVPTCGIVKIVNDSSYWVDFVPGKATVAEWFFPKTHIY